MLIKAATILSNTEYSNRHQSRNILFISARHIDQVAQKGSLLIFLSILFYPSGRASSCRIVAVMAFQANAENDKSWSIGYINSFGKRSFQCRCTNKCTNTDFFIIGFLWSLCLALNENDIHFYVILQSSVDRGAFYILLHKRLRSQTVSDWDQVS